MGSFQNPISLLLTSTAVAIYIGFINVQNYSVLACRHCITCTWCTVLYATCRCEFSLKQVPLMSPTVLVDYVNYMLYQNTLYGARMLLRYLLEVMQAQME